MSFGSVEFSDNIGTYKDSIGRPYTLIKKVPNPNNDPSLLNAGASLLLEQGGRNYGTIQFGGILSNTVGGGSVTVGADSGSIWSGKRPTASNTSGNYYPLGFEMGFNSTGGATNGIAFTSFGGILVMSISANGVIKDGGGFDTLSSTTLGTRVVNSSLTSLGTLTSLTVNGNVTVKPAANLLKIDATSELVGIGVGTPAHKLDVAGAVNTSTTYKIGGVDVLSGTTLGSSVVNSSLTSVGTLTDLTVSGNISGGTLSLQSLGIFTTPNVLYYDTATKSVSYGAAGTASLLPITLDTTNNRVGINNITPTTALDVNGTITATNLAGTLTTAAQPNITSVGTLANVNTTGVYQINGTDFLASRNGGSVAIGATTATSQGTNAIGIGTNAGRTSQQSGAVAIGLNAGNSGQGLASIAIGQGAGQTNQHNNSICINAAGGSLNSDGTSRCFVRPIRNNTTATSLLQYDATSGEITYGPTNIAGTLTTAAQPNVTSVGTLTGLTLSGGLTINTGSGSPESVVTAPVGSLYLRSDGGAGTTLYVKESGTGNTGWIAK